MGETGVLVDVLLAWSDEPELRVEVDEAGLRVHAHPGLSESQVAMACTELGVLGPDVMQAWRRRLGA